MSGLCTAQFWPRYCWHLTPPMVISHHKSGRTSLIRISRPLLNHHSPKKAWLLKYQCQDLSDKEGWATAGNIYTTSNRPETGKKRGQQWRQHQFHFLPSFSTCQVTWPPQGEEIVQMTTRFCHLSGTFPAQNGSHLIIASRIIRCVSFRYYKLPLWAEHLQRTSLQFCL